MYTVGIDEMPTAFRLLQNAPNPFNPMTTIAFEVPPGGGPVNLSIFDVTGRHVVTLTAGACAPGFRQLVWDGRDERGESVASGVYFARMVAPEYTASKKMVLLR
jgi:flagellar hook assembly protein FlgD